MNVLIVGCGYVGLALGTELLRQGHQVWGVRRNEAGGKELKRAGITPVMADITEPESFSSLPTGCDWVVNCTAAGGGGAEEYRGVYLEGNRNLLAWLAKERPRKFVYTSSSGVYTQNDGSTVDEATPLLPAGGTTRVLVEAERLVLDAARNEGVPAVVLRVAGIYGPDRGYWLKQFLAGTAEMEGSGSRRLNMIHRDDVAGAIIAALERGEPGEVYNAADNEPPTQLMVFEWLSRRLNLPVPPRRAEIGEGASRRGTTHKLVSNRKLRGIAWTLKYPTFREGYEAELKRIGK